MDQENSKITILKFRPTLPYQGFPGASDSKESACNAGDPDSIPGLGRSPGEKKLPIPEFHGQRSLVGYIPSMELQRVGHD